MNHPVDPARRVSFRIPKRPNGTGVAYLSCQAATADFFQLWGLPEATEGLAPSPSGGSYRGRLGNPNPGQRYRIAYGDPWASGKVRSASFSLSKGHTQLTLQVVTDHLNAVGVEWLWLCNAHGNRLSLGAFLSDLSWTLAA
jgi:hypothetical protein